jgi:predicted transcriptional regulator
VNSFTLFCLACAVKVCATGHHRRLEARMASPSRRPDEPMTITLLSHKFPLTQEIRASIMGLTCIFTDLSRQEMAETAAPKMAEEELLRMTADVVAAYVSNNMLPTAQLAEVINAVYNSLKGLEGQVMEPPPEPVKPAVPIRKSITPDYLICLEDGKKLKMLKRHLRSTYNMTPDEYRLRWGLAPDYPMVAPNYAEQRSAFAKKIGLGRGAARQSVSAGAKK